MIVLVNMDLGVVMSFTLLKVTSTMFYATFYPTQSLCIDGYSEFWDTVLMPAIIADIKRHPTYHKILAEYDGDAPEIKGLAPDNGIVDKNWSSTHKRGGLIKLNTSIASLISRFPTCSSIEYGADNSINSQQNTSSKPYQSSDNSNSSLTKEQQDAQDFIDNQNRQFEQSKQYQDGLQNALQQGMDSEGNIDAGRLASNLPTAQTTEQAYTNLAVTGAATIGQIIQQNQRRKEAWERYRKAANKQNKTELSKAYEQLKDGIGFTDENGQKQGVWTFYTEYITKGLRGEYQDNQKQGWWTSYQTFKEDGSNRDDGIDTIRTLTEAQAFFSKMMLPRKKLSIADFIKKHPKGGRYSVSGYYIGRPAVENVLAEEWEFFNNKATEISKGSYVNGLKHGVWNYFNTDVGSINHLFSMLDGKRVSPNTKEEVTYYQGVPVIYKLYKYNGEFEKLADYSKEQPGIYASNNVNKGFTLIKEVEYPKLIDSKTQLEYMIIKLDKKLKQPEKLEELMQFDKPSNIQAVIVTENN